MVSAMVEGPGTFTRALGGWSIGLVLATGCYQGAGGDGDGGGDGTGTDTANNPSGQADAGETDPDPTGGQTDTGDTNGAPRRCRRPPATRGSAMCSGRTRSRILFGLPAPTGYSKLFIGDPISGGFDNNSEALKVGATLWTDYQRGAELVAELVAADPALLAKIAPQRTATANPGPRLHHQLRPPRLPASAHPRRATRHLEIFNLGVATPGELAAFPAGVRLVVQSMLQSPFFLYRVETTNTDDGTGKIAPAAHELASKLSYMLWNTMPDDEAVRRRRRRPARRRSRRRRPGHPHARRPARPRHGRLLPLPAARGRPLQRRYKDPVKFPGFDPAMNSMMAQETMMFIDEVVFKQNGDLATLLTAPYTFVNAALAPLYGVQGQFTDAFVKVDLDPSQRAGVLTQLGFLASNAGASRTTRSTAACS